MNWESVPEWLRQFGHGIGGIFLAAWIGRMAWHVEAVKMGRRKFWSLHLVWEVPTAFFMAMAADGLVDWLMLSGKPRLAVIVVVAYLGPRGIEALLKIWVERINHGKP